MANEETKPRSKMKIDGVEKLVKRGLFIGIIVCIVLLIILI